MKQTLRRIGVGLVVLLALLYAGDDLSLRFRIPRNRPQFGTVHVQPYLAVPRKDGKTEFILDDAVDQACVYSLFPHFGDQPCWYLERQKHRRVDL